MDISLLCYELACDALYRAGLTGDIEDDACLLSERIEQAITSYIENLDGEDEEEERRLDNAERAKAINGER